MTIPPRFPALPGQGFSSLKSPTWSTTIKESRSGRLLRKANWAYPRWRFKVSYEVIRDRPTQIELQRLYAFLCDRMGSFGDFFYLDPFDSVATVEPFGTGDGVTTAFQLTRTLNLLGTGQQAPEPIFAVVGTPTIYQNAVATGAFTLPNNPSGVVTFTVAPGAGVALTWSGTFLFWCHFAKDDLSAAQLLKDLWSVDGLEFESLFP